jgi:hypothetical protein
MSDYFFKELPVLKIKGRGAASDAMDMHLNDLDLSTCASKLILTIEVGEVIKATITFNVNLETDIEVSAKEQ